MNRFTQVEAYGTSCITSCSSRQYNRKRAGIDALVRGSSTRFFSSQDLDWNGVCLEFHDASPTERSESLSADHVIALFTNHRARGESEISPGRFAPYSYSPGTINVFPAGSIPACRPATHTKMIVCSLDPSLLSELSAESDLPQAAHERLQPRVFSGPNLQGGGHTFMKGGTTFILGVTPHPHTPVR
jgi:hypothetical protein